MRRSKMPLRAVSGRISSVDTPRLGTGAWNAARQRLSWTSRPRAHLLRGLFHVRPGIVAAPVAVRAADEEVRVSDETPEQTIAESTPPAPPESVLPTPPQPPNGVEYDASAITVLEGLEAVRKRPGMYIGSTGERGLHHLITEIVDNAVDEALAGYCDRIVVTLLADGGIRVEDNGRGIPTDTAPGQELPAVTLALTMLHAGGKFGGGGYKGSGGLHGVGVSGVNALASHLLVEGRNRGHEWRQSFTIGVPDGPLEQVRPMEPGEHTGTTVTYWASEAIFETTTYSLETIASRFREYAFLNKGLEIVVRDERLHAEESAQELESDPMQHEGAGDTDATEVDVVRAEGGAMERRFRYDRGLVDYVEHLNRRKDKANPTVISFEASTPEGIEQQMSLEVAMQW